MSAKPRPTYNRARSAALAPRVAALGGAYLSALFCHDPPPPSRIDLLHPFKSVSSKAAVHSIGLYKLSPSP